MGQVAVPDEECTYDAEATSFNAEAHLQCFEEEFSFYEQQCKNWCLCLISDDTNTNMKVARLSGKPIVGCSSHKLNVDMNAMTEGHGDLSRTVDRVHNTMKAANSKKMQPFFEI